MEVPQGTVLCTSHGMENSPKAASDPSKPGGDSRQCHKATALSSLNGPRLTAYNRCAARTAAAVEYNSRSVFRFTVTVPGVVQPAVEETSRGPFDGLHAQKRCWKWKG